MNGTNPGARRRRPRQPSGSRRLSRPVVGTARRMSYRLSRMLSAGTVSYGGYALARPRHLGAFLTSDRTKQGQYDALARIFGARDVGIGAFGMLGRSSTTVTTAMLLRIAMDVSDGVLLSREAEDDGTRGLLYAATFGWASLNALALVVDRRRARRRA